MEMAAAILIWFITLGSCLIFSSADPLKGCTHHATIGQRYELPLPLPKDSRLRWLHAALIIYDSKKSEQSLVTEKGSLIFPKVAKTHAGSYTAEVLNSKGNSEKRNLVLCVYETIQKPSLTFKCDSKVRFNCSVPQNKDISYQWLEDGNIITNEEAAILVRTFKKKPPNSITCKVYNPANSQISNAVSVPESCFKPKDEGLLLGLDFWLMVGILAGGGGLVLLLIVATIACCTINKKKRRLRVKDEQELRLQWSTTSHQHHQYTNQRGLAHSNNPAHTRDPSSGQTTVNQGPAAAGHTGPRPPRSRLNRPRPPDPITGQPLPGPRRQVPTETTQVPTIGNDEENPPPLPQPRKKAPKTQKL